MTHKNTNTQAAIDNDCTPDRHIEYGPKIGPDGIGLWFTYKHLAQIASDHLLSGAVWSSRQVREPAHAHSTAADPAARGIRDPARTR